MTINILAFGQITDITGKTNWKMTKVKNTAELKQRIEKEFPLLASVSYVMAVNRKIIDCNTVLHHGDTVALLPPFSGG